MCSDHQKYLKPYFEAFIYFLIISFITFTVSLSRHNIVITSGRVTIRCHGVTLQRPCTCIFIVPFPEFALIPLCAELLAVLPFMHICCYLSISYILKVGSDDAAGIY